LLFHHEDAEKNDVLMNSLGDNEISQISPATVRPPGLRAFRLEVVRQLLGDLDIITVAGLHFTMDKIIDLLEREFVAAELTLSELQKRGLRRALGDLGREQGRLLPEVEAFVVRAQMIADTLSLT
jgi:hypothetical protein